MTSHRYLLIISLASTTLIFTVIATFASLLPNPTKEKITHTGHVSASAGLRGYVDDQGQIATEYDPSLSFDARLRYSGKPQPAPTVMKSANKANGTTIYFGNQLRAGMRSSTLQKMHQGHPIAECVVRHVLPPNKQGEQGLL